MSHFREKIDAIRQEAAVSQAMDAQISAGERALEFGAEQIGPFRDIGIEAGGLLGDATLGQDVAPPQFQGFNLDPERVTNNPLFQALQQEQTQNLIGQRAALGLGGSSGTRDLFTRNALILGSQFQQQDVNRQQLGFQNENQVFQNQLQANQARFGQIFDRTRLGANAASQLGTSGQSVIQNIGNARSAGIIGATNATTGLSGSNTTGLENVIGFASGLIGGGNPLSGLFG